MPDWAWMIIALGIIVFIFLFVCVAVCYTTCGGRGLWRTVCFCCRDCCDVSKRRPKPVKPAAGTDNITINVGETNPSSAAPAPVVATPVVSKKEVVTYTTVDNGLKGCLSCSWLFNCFACLGCGWCGPTTSRVQKVVPVEEKPLLPTVVGTPVPKDPNEPPTPFKGTTGLPLLSLSAEYTSCHT